MFVMWVIIYFRGWFLWVKFMSLEVREVCVWLLYLFYNVVSFFVGFVVFCCEICDYVGVGVFNDGYGGCYC